MSDLRSLHDNLPETFETTRHLLDSMAREADEHGSIRTELFAGVMVGIVTDLERRIIALENPQ